MKTKHEGVCKGCAKGKNMKKTFPSSESKAKGILEILQSDVCSPMSSSSLRRYVYYVSFIDDFSRKTWIYFIKNKHKVFSKFKEFKALIENHTEKKIKTFRSDNNKNIFIVEKSKTRKTTNNKCFTLAQSNQFRHFTID